MVGTRLAISFGEDRMSLTEFKVSTILQLIELPFNEGAVERIRIGCNEGTSPVSEDTKIL
jgi:hypothetical protein